MTFNSLSCTRLEALPKNLSFESGIALTYNKIRIKQNAYCAIVAFDLLPNTEYSLDFINCDESFTYMYSPITVTDKGITILSPKQVRQGNPYIENYHFTPPQGWLNDPNGLCFYGGVYHLFYQFYPHSQQWGNMHWGHAVSNNLTHWRHMPVFFTPQQELIENPSLAGGAFSGSAICMDNKLRFFLTRHSALKTDESTMTEYQTTAVSIDGIKPLEESIIINNNNPAHLYHFRDPKVFTKDNLNYMVLGSAVNNIASVLLYSSNDYDNWSYKGTVLQIQNRQCVTIECPDMFLIENKYVCVAAHMCVIDECKRKSPVYWYIGDFCNNNFTVQSSGLYDFGANFYAVQSFSHKGRRIAIGWINDFYNEHIELDAGVCGSMSLPRELTIKDDRLYQRPVKEVYSLIGKQLYSGNDNVNYSFNTNTWYAKLTLALNAGFNLIIARDSQGNSLSVICEDCCLVICTTKCGGLALKAPCKANQLEIFADGRCFEFFVNDGEAAAAKTFYSDNPCGCFCLSETTGLEDVRLYNIEKRCENV